MNRVHFLYIKFFHTYINKQKLFFLFSTVVTCLLFFVMAIIAAITTFAPQDLAKQFKNLPFSIAISKPVTEVLQASTENKQINGNISFNLPAIFNAPVTINSTASVSGNLTAPNILYGIIAGQNVAISGDPQNPTISTTGVSSLQGQSGAVTLTAGSGISINDLTISATGGNSFENIKVGSSTITAGSSTDTLEFVAGGGISLSADTTNKKLTITNSSSALSGLTTNGVLYADSSTTAVSLTPGTSGYILQSNGTGTPPSWVAPTSQSSISFTNITSGTNTTAAMVVGAGASLTYSGGTATSGVINANQLLGGTWAAPGTIGSGTPSSGAFTTLSASGTTTFNGITYTWPGSQTSSFILQTNGTGTLSWIDPGTLPNSDKWDTINGVITPKIETQDLLLGSQATSSAKFAVLNVNSGTPTASLSAGVAGGAYLTADGTLQTTANQRLTLGGSSTGDIYISPRNSSGTLALNVGSITVNGNTGSTSVSPTCVSVTNGIVTGTGACGTGSGGSVWTLNSTNGTLYPINSSLDTFIGGVSTASAKFGFLNVSGGTPTASISAGTAGATFLTADGQLQTTAKQSLTFGGGNTGNIVLSGFGTGLIHSNASGVLSSSAVNLAGGSTEVTGILPVGNGGTGVNGSTASNGQLLIGNGSGFSLSTLTAGSGITITNGSGTISIAQTSSGASKWTQDSTNGVLYPNISTLDLLVGGVSTSSAKFAVINIAGGTPTASISANSGNNALFITGAGNLATTNRQSLTIGGSSTGDIILQPRNSTGFVGINTAAPTAALTVKQSSGSDDIVSVINGSNASVFNINGNGWASFTPRGSDGLAYRVFDSTGVFSKFAVNTSFGAVGINTAPQTSQAADPALAIVTNAITQIGLRISPVNSSQTADYFQIQNAAGTNLDKFDVNGYLGIGTGTNTLISTADIRALSGTISVASISGQTSFAGLIVDNSGFGDIFSASKSGASKFTILNNGNISWAGTSNFQNILNTNATAARTYTFPDASGTICLSGQTCSSTGVVGYWQRNSGALAPANITDDLLLGSTSTSSARFAVINIAGGTPTASLSAGVAGGAYLTATGNLQTTANQPLTIGGSSTGDITISPKNGAGRLVINTTASFPDRYVELASTSTAVNLQFNPTTNDDFTIGADNNGFSIFNDTDSTYGFLVNQIGNAVIGNSTANVGSFARGLEIYGTNAALALTSASGKRFILGSDNGNPGLLFRDDTAGAYRMFIDTNGKVAIGTDFLSPLATLDIHANTAHQPIASLSGTTSFAGLIVDNNGGGALFSASKSGASKFTILNNGNISWAGESNFQNVLATSATAARTYTFPDASGTICLSGQTCSSTGVVGYWQRNSGALSPANITDDLLIGGVATSSATFHVFGAAGLQGTQPVASISANTSFASLVVDNKGSGDLFTASNSGFTRFKIRNNGGIAVIGEGLDANATVNAIDATITSTTGLFAAGTTFRTYAAAASAASLSIFGHYNNIEYSTPFTANWTGDLISTLDQVNWRGTGNSSTGRLIGSAGKIVSYSGAGTIENAMAFVAEGTFDGGTVTNSYGLRVYNPTGASTVTNAYGVYINSITRGSTLNYALYSAGGTNYFGGQVGIGTATPTTGVALDARGLSGTTPVASISGQTSFAALVVDNKGAGDLFTASSSGLPRFTINQNGNVGIGTTLTAAKLESRSTTEQLRLGYDASNYTSFTVASNGTVTIAPNGTSALTLDAFGSGSVGLDLSVARFLGVGTSASSGTQARFQTVNASTVGFDVTGSSNQTANLFNLNPNFGNTQTWFDESGNLRIGGSAPDNGKLNITGAYTGKALAIFDETGDQDILSASASGIPKFTLTRTGGIKLGTNEGVSTQCLTSGGSGGAATWQSCALGQGTNYWQSVNPGTITPYNTTVDLLTGGVSSASATFHLYGSSNSQGISPIASIAANTSFAAFVVDNKGSGDLFTASSSGLARFTINQNGNVGIGTTLPTQLLEVTNSSNTFKTNGRSLTVDRNDTICGSEMILANQSVQYWSMKNSTNACQNMGTLYFNAGASPTERLALTQSGHLGIGVGTTLPIATFDLRATTATFPVASISGSTNAGFASLVVDNTGTGDLFTASSSGLNRFVIKQNGNVGIGTATPTTLLSVGTIATMNLLLNNSVSTSDDPYSLGMSTGASNSQRRFTLSSEEGTNRQALQLGDGTTTDTIFGIGTSADTGSTWNSRFIIKQNGNIGIGTISPLATLDVRGNLVSGGGTIPIASLSAQTSFAALLVDNKGAGDLFTASSSGLTRFSITQNGNVRIGDYQNAGSSPAKPVSFLELMTRDFDPLANVGVNSNYQMMIWNGNGTNGTGAGIGFANTQTINNVGASIIMNRLGSNSQGALQFYTKSSLVSGDAPQLVFTLNAAGATASVSGTSGFAALVADNKVGDLFTASSSGLNRFVITQNGNVGIGTTLPSALLQINQAFSNTTAFLINADAATFGDPALFSIKDELGTGRISYDNLIRQTTIGGGIKGIWDSAGLVAWTDDPSATALRIGGASSNAQTGNLLEVYAYFDNTTAAKSGLKFAINPSGTISTASVSANTSFAAMVVDNTGTGDLFTASSSGLNRFVVKQNGSVGIGTTLPSSYLHIVQGTTTQSALRIDASNSNLINTIEVYDHTGGAAILYSSTFKTTTFYGGLGSLNTPAVGIQSNSATGIGISLRVGHLSGSSLFSTAATASISAKTSFATLVIDNNGVGDIITASSSGLNRFVVKQNGNVNIGTQSAALSASPYKLYVSDYNPATAAAMIENTAGLKANGATGACGPTINCETGLIIKIGAPGLSATPGSRDRWSVFMDGIGNTLGKIRGNNTLTGVSYDTGGGDYAEWFRKADPAEEFNLGDVVCQASNGGVTKCTSTNNSIIGAISDNSGFVGNSSHDDDTEHYVLVGLLGHIKVKVSAQNGTINPGDMVAVGANQTGIAIKATQAGEVLGRAIDGYNNTDPNVTGQIMVYVSKTWYDPSIYLTSTGNVNIFENNSGNNSTFTVKDESGNDITRVGLFAKAVVGDLKSGNIDVQKLTLAGQDINSRLSGVEQTASQTATLTTDLSSLQSKVLGLSDKVASQESTLQLIETLTGFTASAGAQLGLDKLDAKDITVGNTLNVLGRTTLNDLGVTGNITAGTLTIRGLDETGQASINSIGNLKLQDLGAGGLDILNGKVIVDTTGNVNIKETLTAKVVKTTKLDIIDDTTSTTSATLSASAGSIVIPAGDMNFDVDTTALTANSLIFVTPDQPILIGAKKKDADTFTIKLQTPQTTSVKVNWWIVN